jgi:hypothetical protein
MVSTVKKFEQISWKTINRIQSWKNSTQGLIISTVVTDGNFNRINVRQRVVKAKSEEQDGKKLKKANWENESEREKRKVEQRQSRKIERMSSQPGVCVVTYFWESQT